MADKRLRIINSDSPALQSRDLYWIAGILEGEGSFQWHRFMDPIIKVGMTDRDVIDRIAKILHQKCRGPYYGHGIGLKPMFECALTGRRAIALMMTLYPMMGIRRKSKIKEILESLKIRPPWSGNHVGEHNGRAKLTYALTRRIKTRFLAGETGPALALEYGVTPTTIYFIAKGKIWARSGEQQDFMESL